MNARADTIIDMIGMPGIHTITGEAHEQVSNLLDQAVAILRCLREPRNPNDSQSVANAVWAVDDMIERAHDLIGHV